MPDASTIVGYVASVASISAFVPQLYKVIKTRDTKSLALPMWIFEVITFVLWTTYGVLLGNVPIIVTNAVCGAMAVAILTMKLVLPDHSNRHERSTSRHSARPSMVAVSQNACIVVDGPGNSATIDSRAPR